MKYVESKAPIIVFNRDEWTYVCVACKTKTQPEGKCNTLRKRSFIYVKHFLDQHLDGPRHLRNVARWEAQKESNLVDPSEGSAVIQCPGLCITRDGGQGRFAGRAEESKLWASHSNLSSVMCSHQYWSDHSSGNHWVRRQKCSGTYRATAANEERQCCATCFSLSGAGGLLNRVNHFGIKFYSALLLRSKLFGLEPEVEKTIAEIEETSFAQRNATAWGKIKQCTNLQLQQSVRKHWRKAGQDERTAAGEAFFQTCVQMCLRIHPEASSSQVTVFSHQLLDALQCKNQSASWHDLAMHSSYFLYRISKYQQSASYKSFASYRISVGEQFDVI